MAIELITGRAGRAHVDSSDVRAFNAYATASGRYVLHGGGAEIESANNLRVLPAEILVDGAHVRITGTGEELTLENGASSYDRIDVVALHYTSVGSDDSRVESVALEVIKGTPVDTGGNAQDPAMPVPDTSILDGSSEVYVPYVRVKITGLVPGNPEELLPGRVQMLKDMITGLTLSDVSGTLPINKGGTGATSAADARTSLGLGALAMLGSPLHVANGGTGSTSAGGARTALGVPPTSHASSATTYGAGNASNYGHVKLTDSTSATNSASSGVAASPKMVRDFVSPATVIKASVSSEWSKMSVFGYRIGRIIIVTFGGEAPYLGPNLSKVLATGLPNAVVETYNSVSAWSVGNNNSLYASVNTSGVLTIQNRNSNTVNPTRFVGEVVYVAK